MLSKRHRYRCRLYLLRAYLPPTGRHAHRKSYGTNDALYRRLHRSPWLLATSLPHTRNGGKAIVRAYQQRMQIEEAFRDLKNHRWGFGLRYARSKNTLRLEVLLLIALLATLLLWLFGLAAKAKNWTRYFQANTERKRTVLSVPFLGQQIWRSHRFKLSRYDLQDAFRTLQRLVIREAQYA